MHPRTTALALCAGAALALTGCSSTPYSTPDRTAPPVTTPATVRASMPSVPHTKLATGARTAACWAAIRDQYTPGTMRLTGAPTTPPACAGLSTDEVSAVAEDVLAHQLD